MEFAAVAIKRNTMVQVMNGLPFSVAAFRATGEVNRQDYERVIIPAIEALLTRTDEINFLLLLETPVKNFTMGAWMKDLAVGLKHLCKWRKMAIISDEEGVNRFTDAFSYIAPGEAKGFAMDELETAKKWVAA